MHIYKSPDIALDKAPVLVIGNFDGVHRGHCKLLARAREIAAEHQAPLAVLSFEPHPRHLFRPDDPPFRLTPEALKVARLQACGVDLAVILPFDWDFASQSAEAFIQNVLQDGIKPMHIVVGYDFAFGQLRKGTPDTLRDAGFAVTVIEEIADEEGDKFSSSAIRACIRHGEIAKANALLGWDWEIQGTVVKGDQRGRELGYPTANVPLGETIHPGYGVYACLVRIEGEETWRAAATNIGIRPMFELPVGQVEAHILDFDRDIYGKTLHIRPVKRLRGEAKFDSLDALIAQIEKDCDETRNILRDHI
ncbi:MAG: bifunctional riboflavin kinase/FAD synthetase [Rhodospirillales bacterium]|nr:bifunctional riboflavin kinase/FAD synthetase [Rhodospirillales bacterium]MCB9996877.1 bifunctional riboflavin kinase/FAD synthetase [Rhodospirillales bacterium]